MMLSLQTEKGIAAHHTGFGTAPAKTSSKKFQNVLGNPLVLGKILEAVVALPGAQLVLSVGRNLNLDDLGPIPSNAIVVPTAPQIELLMRAALCVTHAGVHSAL